MEFKMGVPVMASDGRAGTLEGLIFDPARGEVTGLVVTRGFLLPRDVVVPVERVTHADDEGVRVQGTAAEIAELPGFSQAQFTAPPQSWLPPSDQPADAGAFFYFPASPYAVGAFAPSSAAPEPAPEPAEDLPPAAVDVSRLTEVRCTDGTAGVVDEVLTEGESDRVTHLIVRRGSLLTRDLMVPVAHVREVNDDVIELDLTLEQLDAMPEYDPEDAE
jgi:uncharacterized protein YrrD